MGDPLKPVVICGRLSILNKVGIHVLFRTHPVLKVNNLPRVLILVIPLLLKGLICSGKLLRCLLDAFKVFIIILTFISPMGQPFLKSELNPAVQSTLAHLLVDTQFWG